MASRPCDYCGKNTLAEPFYMGDGLLLLPPNLEKKVRLRVCKDCCREYRLVNHGFARGYKDV